MSCRRNANLVRFKPFIYSAALEKGYTAATTVNDAPVVFDDPLWSPPGVPKTIVASPSVRPACDGR